MSNTLYKSLAETALNIGKRRADLLAKIREALLTDDTGRAISLMRVYVGIDEEQNEEGDRTSSGLH